MPPADEPADESADVPPASTLMTAYSQSGQLIIDVRSTEGFRIGDWIRLNAGQPNQEDARIVGFGSIRVETPLTHAHSAGETVTRIGASQAMVPPASDPELDTPADGTDEAGRPPAAQPSDEELELNAFRETLRKVRMPNRDFGGRAVGVTNADGSLHLYNFGLSNIFFPAPRSVGERISGKPSDKPTVYRKQLLRFLGRIFKSESPEDGVSVRDPVCECARFRAKKECVIVREVGGGEGHMWEL